MKERAERQDGAEESEQGDQQGPQGGDPPARRKREDPSAETEAALADIKKAVAFGGTCKAMFGVRFG